MKKLASILLALVMIFAMSANAFAAEPASYELTISGIQGHTYNVYQIYTGDISKEGTTLVLSNIKYGVNNVPIDKNVGDLVPDTALKDFLNSADQSSYFLRQITNPDDPYAVVNENGTNAFETITVAAGYYLILDVTDDSSLPEGQTKSPVLLKVAENITIQSKHATISSEKKVDDKNDSTTDEDGINWQDAADYDIGDEVPFKLSVDLPSTFDYYNTYALTFHDKQAAGLNYPTNFVVYVERMNGDNAEILFALADGVDYNVVACTSENCEFGGCTFTVAITDLEQSYETAGIEFAEGDKLVVTYQSVLNDGAVVGSEGNMNYMYVCHPDGHTPVDGVTVLTYGLTVNKIDGTSKEALKGAGFTLYKWSAAANDYVAVGNELKGDELTSFVWEGIDGGKYKLVETTTPVGYNTIADIEFVVDATHKTEWLLDGNDAFEDVIAKDPSGAVVVFADKENGVQDGKLAGNIENYKGTVLPETGAAGTMMFVAAGTVLVVLASVFMITRKKMSIYED